MNIRFSYQAEGDLGKLRLKFVIENHEAKIINIKPRDKAYD
jgi:hypothetical protein